MHVQFYILPIQIVTVVLDPETGTPVTVNPRRGPKYLKWLENPAGMDVIWSMKDYGHENTAIVAVNADPADHAILAAYPDVYQYPENLDVNLSPADITEISDFMEVNYIPSDWITPSDTFRSALKTTLGMFMSVQRYTGITGLAPTASGINMNDQLRNWPQEAQDAFTQVWTEFGGKLADLKSNWTARILLKNLADLWGTKPIIFGGFITI
jgi:hypothetical protein